VSLRLGILWAVKIFLVFITIY